MNLENPYILCKYIIWICIYANIYMWIYKYKYIHMWIYIYTHRYIHMWIYIYTNIYIYTHIYLVSLFFPVRVYYFLVLQLAFCTWQYNTALLLRLFITVCKKDDTDDSDVTVTDSIAFVYHSSSDGHIYCKVLL